jgi:hypothetical protein
MPDAQSGLHVAADRPPVDTDAAIDTTLIDWFLSLSPWERLAASASWAPLYDFHRAETR